MLKEDVIYGAVHLVVATFVQLKLPSQKKISFLFPLVEMLLSMKGTKPQEGFFIGSKLTEIFIFGQVNLAKTF